MATGETPFNQLDVQKDVVRPFHTCTRVADENRASSVLSIGISEMYQGCSGFFHLYQIQQS
jgi:hypothetical protein